MTSFVYVVAIAFHASKVFQRFGSAWIALGKKKVSWLRTLPLLHRLQHLSAGPERLASHRLFQQSIDTKVTGRGVGVCRVRRMCKTLEGQILDCCNSWAGSMWPSVFHLTLPRSMCISCLPNAPCVPYWSDTSWLHNPTNKTNNFVTAVGSDLLPLSMPSATHFELYRTH